MNNSKKPMWTKAEINTFDDLINATSSPHQVERITARLDQASFITEHGRAKCDAMFAHLEAGGAVEDGPLVEVQS